MAKLTNDLQDLRNKKIIDLEKLVLEIRENQFKNRMKHKTGQLNESHLLTAVSYTHLPSPRDVEESRMPSSA